ncbi:MAG: hypothetical protein R3315_07655 [Woeseiaceae bacterium]|nr:hypothetical protein [Woeseiaceae bacterium]
MAPVGETLARYDLHRIQQTIKWIVYALLLVNFGFYFYEDWQRAFLTLGSDASLVDWAGEFATSIDEAAWFILLFMFELETYILEDEDWKGWVASLVRGVRIVCFAMIAHTVIAYGDTVVEYSATVPIEDAQSLCSLADSGATWVYNLEYTEIDEANCSTLTESDRYFRLGEHQLVTSEDGLRLERRLAWVDVIEASAWLLIILAIEAVVWLQERGISRSGVITAANAVKTTLYLLLFGFAGYWALLGHWLYAWDEVLWIAGFWAIELNVREWRDELAGAAGPSAD